MKRTVLSLIVALAAFSVGSARAAEGPRMSALRQLDLSAQHLAATAQQEAQKGALTGAAAETAVGFAALMRDFRFELEGNYASSLQADIGWDQLAEGFVATRDLLQGSDSGALQNELLRVNGLMNRLDRSLGGPGFWSGPHGWNG